MANDKKENENGKLSRRDIIAGLAALPIVGLVGYGLLRSKSEAAKRNSSLLRDIKPEIQTGIPALIEGKTLRIGIIGSGGRGGYLMKALGFVNPDRIDEYTEKGKTDKYWLQYLEDFRAQENLNVKITAICDVFDKNADRAIAAGANVHRNGKGGAMDDAPKRFTTYNELIDSPDVDAVIIATPDHWHVPIAIEAARNGKHVYCEKPLSWSVAETYEIRDVVKKSGVVFQLGHQGRQTESYNVARSLIKQDVIGKISLIEVCTNRNDPNGAWVYDIAPEANEQTIDWKQFIGQAPWHDFSLERFFRWRCWWEYSTGLSGDLFTHEFDALNQILDLGIPNSVVASGGIYFFKDGRTVPDVLNMALEYPDRDFTLLYSATLASEKNRGKVIMGHDAYLELSDTLLVNVDPRSTRYKEKLEQGIVEAFKPIFSYVPGQGAVDAITSPTEKYFAGRGLLYTYRDGKAVDTTHLHLREWINCIRAGNGAQPSCNIDQAFQEAMAAHMGTIAYKEGRRTYWDAEKEVIV